MRSARVGARHYQRANLATSLYTQDAEAQRTRISPRGLARAVDDKAFARSRAWPPGLRIRQTIDRQTVAASVDFGIQYQNNTFYK